MIAGHVNREVFDGAALAHNVDEIRRDDAVAQQVGIAISDALIRANPDLVALGPLVQQVSINVAGGDLLSRPVQAGVQAAYSALVDGDDSIVLRLADVGAVVTAVLATVAPDRAPVSSDVSVTLATLGDGEPGDTLAWVAHYVETLAWMLPLATLMTFAGAVWLSRDRWWVGASIGRALVWAAGRRRPAARRRWVPGAPDGLRRARGRARPGGVGRDGSAVVVGRGDRRRDRGARGVGVPPDRRDGRPARRPVAQRGQRRTARGAGDLAAGGARRRPRHRRDRRPDRRDRAGDHPRRRGAGGVRRPRAAAGARRGARAPFPGRR